MKRSIFLIVIFIVGCTSKNNNTFHLKAHIKGIKEEAKVLLFNYDKFQVMDSTTIKNEAFEFKDVIEYPYEAAVLIKEDTLLIQFWIEQGEISINSNKETLKETGMNYSPYVKSEKINPIIQDYLKLTEPYHNKKAEAYNKLTSNLISEKEYEVKEKEYEKYLDTIYKVSYDFLMRNSNNYFSLSEMINYKEEYSQEQLDNYYNKLPSRLKESPKGMLLKEYMESSIVNVGDVAPEITGKNLEGRKIKLSDYKGDYILLNFWASWCAPCIKKIKRNFPTIKEKYADNNFTIVNYSFDVDEKSWRKVSNQLNIDWVNFSNLTNMGRSPTAFKYGIEEIPTSFLISPEGEILKHISYEDDLIQELAEVLDK